MTARGKFVLTLIILAVVGLGIFKWWDKLNPNTAPAAAASTSGSSATPTDASAASTPAATLAAIKAINDKLTTPDTGAPAIGPAAPYIVKDNTLDLDLSQWAGYAGIIAANGGLEPSENSYFFKKFGFKVRVKLSEESNWSELNNGHFAASGTTVDVLAVQPRNFQVMVPVQIDFSRGADGIVVRKGIKGVNDLKGKILVTEQFTESDFFIRTLAQEAGIGVAMLASLNDRPAADKINLVYTDDAFAAGDLFLKDLQSGDNKLAGCVTWDPKTTEVVDASKGAARILVTNRNLLIVADVLVVNKGFATANPKMVAGLVEGILAGNHQVNENPDAHLDELAQAFKWDKDKAKRELAKVHLSNLPENVAFFSGSMDAAGSFNSIFQSSILAYGPDMIKDPSDPDRYTDAKYLQQIATAGTFAGEVISLAPIRAATSGSLENDPLLSKDIRFLFQPNSSILDQTNKDNLSSLDAIKRLLVVSPGSTILLRGHVDNSSVEKFRQDGGETLVRQMALQAMQLSKDRANEIKKVMIERLKADPARIETIGRGWEEPAGKDPEKNRRVEVQWFTLE